MANETKHHVVILRMVVKADTASEAQSYAETVLLRYVLKWFNEDTNEKALFPVGSLLHFAFKAGEGL